MSPQDGESDWEAEKKRLTEEWNATKRPVHEAIYLQRDKTKWNSSHISPDGDIRQKPYLEVDPSREENPYSKKVASHNADIVLKRYLEDEEIKFKQKAADKEAQKAAEDEDSAQKQKQELENKSKRLAAEVGNYKNPKDIQAQSFDKLQKATADLGTEKPQEQAGEQAAKGQAEKDKLQQQGLAGAKTGEQNVAEVDQASQRDPTPTSMLHNQPPRDYSPLNETERQLAAQLAARQRDENFVETAREITERKIGNPLDGGGLEKSEEKQPVEATQDQKRNEEIIQDRESQEREKALEEIKRRLEQEAEIRKELNKNRGLGRD
jgi:hypothetical protein